MMNSETSSKPLFRNLPKWLIWSFVIVSFIGFIDATYLTFYHYTGSITCSQVGDCNTVLTSKYSEIFGIPVALGGALYYLFIFLFSLFYIDTGIKKLLVWLPVFTIFGLLGSIWFVSIQLFILKEICPYCMLSAGTSLTLFILGIILIRYKKSPTPSS